MGVFETLRFFETLLIAVCLGVDAFSVALGVGSQLGRASKRQTFRLSFHFGLFQFLMPIAGWGLGRSAVGLVQAYDHWVAFAMLAAVGVHMVVGSFRSEKETKAARDPTRGWSLVALSVATSLDALAVGVSFGVIGRRLVGSAVVIGLVAGIMTLIGLHAGGALRAWIGRRLETAGGIVLIGLAVKILTSG